MAARLVPQPRIPAAMMAAEVSAAPSPPAEPPHMSAVVANSKAAMSFQYADLITVSHHDDATDEAMNEFGAKWGSQARKDMIDVVGRFWKTFDAGKNKPVFKKDLFEFRLS